MITDFIDSVVIIDDKWKEIEELAKKLEEEDISVKMQIVNPQDKQFKNIIPLKKYRQLIFMDLSLDDSIDIKNNISTEIRPILSRILPKTKGCYGLVVWSKHTDDISILKEKLLEDKDRYCLPMFIVPFDKSQYLQNGYDNILNDLNKILQDDKTAYFFVNWMSSVKSASGKAISDIYSLVTDYDKQKTELMYILYKMALNHTGIPDDQVGGYDLTTDAYKAFDELLYSDLIKQQNKTSVNIFSPVPQNPYTRQEDRKNDIYSEINSKLFIDTININQKVVVPGNVYEIVDPNIIRLELPEDVTAVKYIAIELTPPCDFSQKKKINSRLIKGLLCDIQYKEKFKKEYYYKDMFPLMIDKMTNLQLVLDFRYLEVIEDLKLQDEYLYKVLFRISPKLFADILQKFSSSYARLGLSKIE
ncbi:hypothetical protein [uncultured Campylobacter sp.]|uniref:hypothetical protein n=1 Tax=uncultured Campylobacter sp. TaxID=218934 RepID=UPI0025DEB5D3|nr:hypothetical protein [uncultured Campylobacter sp.]